MIVELTCPDCKKVSYPVGKNLVLYCFPCEKYLSIKDAIDPLGRDINIKDVVCLENVI